MKFREVLAVAPLVVFVFWIGLQPKFFLDRMEGTLNEATVPVRQSLERMYQE